MHLNKLLMVGFAFLPVGCNQPTTKRSSIGFSNAVIDFIDAETFSADLGLKPGKIHVISAAARSAAINKGYKEEQAIYLVTVDSIDGMRLQQQLVFKSERLPKDMKENVFVDVFASVSIHAGGKLAPSEFASEFPIPLERNNYWIDEPSYMIRVSLVLHNLALRDPLGGRAPPEGERWLLPPNYIEKLVREEQNRDTARTTK